MFKTILVHVDASKSAPARFEVAARLAQAHEAHLIGSASTGLSAFMFPITALDAGTPPVVYPVEQLRARADQALDEFERAASAGAVDSFERRRLDDDAGAGLCLQARYADLVIISQTVPDEAARYLQPDFNQYLVLNCARPVLVLPAAFAGADIGKRITVAWNGSPEAVHAIASALPLLRRAAQVQVVVIDDGKPDVHGEQPGADLALYLARHGVTVEVVVLASDGHDGGRLLSYAAGNASDLIVMGAFGHSRFHEFVLGGATRTALSSSQVALWMAH